MPGTDPRADGPDWWRAGTTVVRPFGYGHDAPIARRIDGTELFVGNAHAADRERCDRSFDRVLSVTAEPRPATTHHRPLVDGPDNEWAAFEAAADTACRLLREPGESLLVHCSHGISRSAVVTAVALAVSEERSLRDALALVRSARPPATVHPVLREQAVYYLAKR
ncbi:dual specificity protein phosphatase family protein [Halosimplex pelagicum]|uniref:Dual specificity protein phosphatase family protein n=1 Tax=Halosimplex pelagicum TaxID=869886 RepID=A0A7D5PAU0_9EURY|nr:dual specificity protein phosphatase family protein [Halosimplex pelagicum]QLH85046.1 dual specificity protein phosphatase family protein [Halosimplex pelagicum]